MQRAVSQRAINIIETEMKEQTGSLILSDCGLTEIPEMVFDMEWLTELIITNGYETADMEMESQSLSGSKYQSNSVVTGEPNYLIALPERIRLLKNLIKIRIGDTGVSTWPIEDLSPFHSLNNLEEVDMSNNRINDPSPLGFLHKLKILKLNHNQIKSINIDNWYFNDLHTLELDNNQIEFFNPKGFAIKYSSLQSLSLAQNKIQTFNLTEPSNSIVHLNLNDNQLSEIKFTPFTKNLETLLISRNKIEHIQSLTELKSIKTLELGSNSIRNIEALSQLSTLETLGLSNNRIEDIRPLKNLHSLSKLYLGNNDITEIEPLTELKNLEEIYLNENKIRDCPPDVWQSNDIRQIRAYFESKKREEKRNEKSSIPETGAIRNSMEEEFQEDNIPPVFKEEIASPTHEIEDVKLIFVGNSAAGKTQLSKYFESGKLDDTRETTHGIRLKRWLPESKISTAFECLKNQVAVNIWDFGGQEYYHGTFRLFLSNYAVYILLWENDTNQNNILPTNVREAETEALQHYHYKYWLDNIRHYAPTSPILIVQNKIDKDPKQRIDTQWIENYKIHGDHYISLHKAAKESKSEFKWSFDLFCNELSHCLKNILRDEVHEQKSFAWLKIRDAIVEAISPDKNKASNPFTEYLKSGNYIALKDFEKACFALEPELTDSEIYTLPRWLHNSGLVIYFGENEQLKDSVFLDPVWVTQGIYSILNDTVRKAHGEFSKKDIKPSKKYPTNTFLALMKEMEIIFEKTDQKDTYVAPQYLPDTHPVEDLYAIAAKGLQQNAFFIRLPLYFFRKVLQRMIFYYGMAKNVDAKYYWKKGILFEKKGTRLMFKGIMPEADREYGIFMIGAEPVGAYRDIQKEVFHLITEILEEKDLSKIANSTSENNTRQQLSKTSSGSSISDIYHRVDNWTERYKEHPETTPGWLRHFEVSVDNKNFVNYLELCNANRGDHIFIESDLKTKLRIHDFELLLDKKPKRPLKVFFSYSHKDTEMMNKLSVHLMPLKRLKKIETWSDNAIQAGDEWDASIESNLRDADIVLFLMSADFIASNYIWEKEIPLAIQFKNDTMEKVSKVIPIYLRPFDYSGLPIADTEMVPKNKQSELTAISKWENIDEAFVEVADRIREVIDGLE